MLKTNNPPSPHPPQKVTRGCMAGALFQNFFGDVTAGMTVGLHVAVVAAAKRLGPLVVPGPGWLYTGIAVLYDAGMVVKSYADCRYGGVPIE